MRNILFICLTCLLLALTQIACEKTHTGGNTQGGLLPTNYITIRDSSFNPAILTVVSGSSITFVNQSTLTHTIRSEDSLTIPPIVIAPDKSYFFKKDTSGSFAYYLVNKPTVKGTIIITP